MDIHINKNGQQLLRLDKIYNEDFFLLDKYQDDNKLIFKICGSTKNIYEVKLYLISKRIYCNCPDSKSWARKYGVICKHSCFVLFKVFSTILCIDKKGIFFFRKASTAISFEAFRTTGDKSGF